MAKISTSDIISHRLFNQQIAETNFTKPAEIVGWLGAMQAQEYAMSKWAIGLRIPSLKDADVEKAFNEGAILRTHVLRPTWHFVTPEDIRWMLALSAPRVHAFSAYYYRRDGLDQKIFKKCNDVLVKTLRGGNFLTRTALQAELAKAKIIADGTKLGHLMMQAELDGIICSGPRQGKQFTYALLEERAPASKTLTRKEALTELTRRYFTSRGPATLQDFAWWSGLTIKEIAEGITLLGKQITSEKINGQEYFFASDRPTIKPNRKWQTSFLMADYDEYGISYKDRSPIFSDKKISGAKNARQANFVFNRMIIVDGKIVGAWKPNIQKKEITVDTVLFQTLSKAKQQEVAKAIKSFLRFSKPTGH